MNNTFSRQLGRSGIQVSAMGLGCWAIGGPFTSPGNVPVGWSAVDDGESIRAIHRALELGVNFFDTSDVYGAGHSEEVLGKALAGRRDGVVIATKFGNVFDSPTRHVTGEDGSPEHARQALEASLRRLNTDYIDLYQFHLSGYPPEKAAPTRDALEQLVEEGKIRGYAWSTDSLERVKVFAEGPHCIAVQQHMNVFSYNAEILALCEERNLASVNRSPLAMGLLTGKFQESTRFPADDVRRNVEWYEGIKGGKPNPAWLRKLDAIRQILTSEGRTLAQGALAWIWARSENTIPIPGFKTVKQAEENINAMQFGPLSKEQMHQIDILLVQ
ncbi:aldo/keto reductase [Candidatus Sumerlaeota bacterium]|nr:aldo/keto reductase [Candidatus Sumerlaeota bacterium]